MKVEIAYMKLSSKELTKAIARYARRHGFYQSAVRTTTCRKQAAIKEYKQYLHDFCPDCNKPLYAVWTSRPEWYGALRRGHCSICDTNFVSQNGGEYEISA